MKNITHHIWTPSRHEEILKSLDQDDSVQFGKLLGKKNILKVHDQNMNGIFHMAAQSDWNQDKTRIIVDHLRLRGLIPQLKNPKDVSTRSSIFSISKELLKSYNFDSQNCKGETPLIVATLNEQEDVVEALLENGVNVDAQDKEGCSAIFYAVARGFRPIVKMLVGSDQGWERSGVDLAYLAAAFGEEGILDLLLEQGANRSGTWTLKDGRTCLMRAVQEKNVSGVKLVKHRMEKDNEAHNQDRANALKKAQEIRKLKSSQLRKGMCSRIGSGGQRNLRENQLEMEKLDDIVKTLKLPLHSRFKLYVKWQMRR